MGGEESEKSPIWENQGIVFREGTEDRLLIHQIGKLGGFLNKSGTSTIINSNQYYPERNPLRTGCIYKSVFHRLKELGYLDAFKRLPNSIKGAPAKDHQLRGKFARAAFKESFVIWNDEIGLPITLILNGLRFVIQDFPQRADGRESEWFPAGLHRKLLFLAKTREAIITPLSLPANVAKSKKAVVNRRLGIRVAENLDLECGRGSWAGMRDRGNLLNFSQPHMADRVAMLDF